MTYHVTYPLHDVLQSQSMSRCLLLTEQRPHRGRDAARGRLKPGRGKGHAGTKVTPGEHWSRPNSTASTHAAHSTETKDQSHSNVFSGFGSTSNVDRLVSTNDQKVTRSFIAQNYVDTYAKISSMHKGYNNNHFIRAQNKKTFFLQLAVHAANITG